MELIEVVLAAFMIAIGLSSFAFSAIGTTSRDRTSIWFGVFTLLYGVRLSGQSELIQPLFHESVWRYLHTYITYIIPIPGIILIESLTGSGRYHVVRRIWQVLLLLSIGAILNDSIRMQPGATLWLNPPVVIIAVVVAAIQIIGYGKRTGWTRELRVAMIGGAVFVCAAGYATFGGTDEMESIAMLLFMLTIAYLLAKRIVVREQDLLAVSRELEVARQIQQSILPRELPVVSGLEVAAAYMPMQLIGGDFYDFHMPDSDSLFVMVADVSGHGIPAALVASMVKMGFASQVDSLETPGLAMANLNRMLCGRFEGAFVTATCGIVDVQQKTLRYATAGHPAPLLLRANGALESLDRGGLLLTFDPDVVYDTSEVELFRGDRLLFYSDGLIEAENPEHGFFDEGHLKKLMIANAGLSPQDLIEKLLADLQEWIGPNEQVQDDVTIVVIDLE